MTKLTPTIGKGTQEIMDYLIILSDQVTHTKINLQRVAETDSMIKMIWKAYNPASLAALWRHETGDVTTRAGDIILEAVIRLDSVTETEVLYDGLSKMQD